MAITDRRLFFIRGARHSSTPPLRQRHLGGQLYVIRPPDRLNLFSGSGGADREPFEKDGPALLIRAGLSLASKEETAPATRFQLWARSAPNGITVRWGPKAAAAIEM